MLRIELGLERKAFMDEGNLHHGDSHWRTRVQHDYSDVGVYVEILDKKGYRIFDGLVHANRSTLIESINREMYTAIAYLPSGEIVIEKIDAREANEKLPLTIGLPQSRSEHISFESFLGRSHRIEENTVVASDVDVQPWEFSSGHWIKSNLRYEKKVQHNFVKFYFLPDEQISRSTIKCVQVTANGRSKSILVSTRHPSELLVLTEENQELRSIHVDLSLKSHNPQLELLFAYLKAGNIQALKKLSTSLLFEKLEDPAGAALGAYFGLLYGGNENLEHWSSNLANWFPKIPDVHIIKGKLLLDQGKILESLSCFLQATEHGLPLYSYGMRILIDSIRMFPETSVARKTYKYLVDYTDRLEWRNPSTCFEGTPQPRYHYKLYPSAAVGYLSLNGYRKEDYSPANVDACRQVLSKLTALLQPFKDKLILVGGWVPSLIKFEGPQSVKHIGSVDIDLLVDTENLSVEGYQHLLQILSSFGFHQSTNSGSNFQLWKNLEQDKHLLAIRLDLLTASKSKAPSNTPTLLRYAPGAELALEQNILQTIAPLSNTALYEGLHQFRVANAFSFLVMKGQALSRNKPKDFYDIEYMIQNSGKVTEFESNQDNPLVLSSLRLVRSAFISPDAVGPKLIADFEGVFLNSERILRKRQAFEVVNGFLSEIPPFD